MSETVFVIYKTVWREMIVELTVLSSIPKQIRSTPTLTCRLHRQTARMNWWVSIRKRSAAPRASEEEPRCPLMPSTLEDSAGRAGRSTARLLLIMMATAVKPQLMMVGPPTFDRLVCFPCIHRFDTVRSSDISFISPQGVLVKCSQSSAALYQQTQEHHMCNTHTYTHCQLI